MRKYVVLFVILFLAVTFEASACSGGGTGRGEIEDGIAVGVEFGSLNSNHEFEHGKMYTRPYVGYGTRVLNEALFIRAEADLTTRFLPKINNVKPDPSNENGLYLNLELEFDRNLNDETTLSFLLQKEFDEILIGGHDSDCDHSHTNAIVSPGVRLSRKFDIGDEIYTEVRLPVTYLNEGYSSTELQSINSLNKKNIKYGLDLAIGWASSFGLSAEAKVLTTVGPRAKKIACNHDHDSDHDHNHDHDHHHTHGRVITAHADDHHDHGHSHAHYHFEEIDNSGISNIELSFTYETGPMFLGLDFDIKRGANQEDGVKITPWVSYNIKHFDIYASWIFDHVRKGYADTLDHSIALGVRYTFHP